MNEFLRRALRRFGFQLLRVPAVAELPAADPLTDLSASDLKILHSVRPFTVKVG